MRLGPRTSTTTRSSESVPRFRPGGQRWRASYPGAVGSGNAWPGLSDIGWSVQACTKACRNEFIGDSLNVGARAGVAGDEFRRVACILNRLAGGEGAETGTYLDDSPGPAIQDHRGVDFSIRGQEKSVGRNLDHRVSTYLIEKFLVPLRGPRVQAGELPLEIKVNSFRAKHSQRRIAN